MEGKQCTGTKKVAGGTSMYMKRYLIKIFSFDKSGTQCRDKLKSEYKKIKDSNTPTGTDRKSGKYFNKLNEILGNKPATMPYVVVDILADDEQDKDIIESGDNTQGHNEGQSIVKDGSEQNDTSNTSCTDSYTTNKRKRPKKIEKLDKITQNGTVTGSK